MSRTHEDTYKGPGPAAMVARRRLRRTMQLFGTLRFAAAGTWADFGCSNGFILSILQTTVLQDKRWHFYGFDKSRRLLDLARARRLANAKFHHFDLNQISDAWLERFDVVTCLETLEHTGDYQSAVLNLYAACRPGGMIIISIPNERGIPGLFKFVGRPLVRRRPYRDFFQDKSAFLYTWHLISHEYIDVFREPPADWWSHHLGFDSRRLREFLERSFLDEGKCRLRSSQASPYMFNHFYLLEKG